MGAVQNGSLTSKITGVSLFSLRQIEDERGAVLHMLNPHENFIKIGEIYFSVVNPGSIKAWKRHKLMTARIAVPVGRIRLVIFDERVGSSSHSLSEEFILGRPDAYNLIIIPPQLWYGFQGISKEPALIANCPDMPHDPSESEYLDVCANRIAYEWKDNHCLNHIK